MVSVVKVPGESILLIVTLLLWINFISLIKIIYDVVLAPSTFE